MSCGFLVPGVMVLAFVIGVYSLVSGLGSWWVCCFLDCVSLVVCGWF